MAVIMLSALFSTGAAGHCLGIARSLRSEGHELIVLTSEDGIGPFLADGFEAHAVPEPRPVEMAVTPPPFSRRPWQLHRRVHTNVIGPLQEQWRSVSRILSERAIDVIVTDPLFLGASMVAALPRAVRPSVVMLGLSAPWLPDARVFPYGMGLAPTQSASRIRVLAYRAASARAFVLLSRSFNREVKRVLKVELKGDLRLAPRHADVWAQLSAEHCEYPRSALPANFRFIGPPEVVSEVTLPTWWDPCTEPPVLVVRDHGRADPYDLLIPAVHAFGNSGSTVVFVGMDRMHVESAFPDDLPSNVHFETHIPWSRLNPRKTVIISNGDYVHAQQALQRGIPMVLTGTLETHLETAARVEWLGAGIALRTNRASPDILRDAVDRIRRDDHFRRSAAQAAVRLQPLQANRALCELVEELSVKTRGTPRSDRAARMAPI